MTSYPADDRWYVRAGRFLNVLDDEVNKLSPVKLNVWAANMSAVSTFAATAMTWFGAHLVGVEQAWALAGGWLAHAHVTHHFDKRERNMHAAQMKGQG